MEKVSVIVPMWNDEFHIIECLRSINTKDDVIGEVIVVDNSSTDNSATLVSKSSIPKIKLIRNGVNVGAAKARHQAIKLASCPLITFLDSDDILGPKAVKDAVKDLIDRQLDISIYTMFKLDQSGNTHVYLPTLMEIISGNEAFNRTIGGWRIHPMGVFKKELYELATSKFDFHGHSDDEVITRHIFLAAKKVGGNNGAYIYRDKVRNYTAHQILGQTITNMRTLQLAIRYSNDANRIRTARNNIVRNLLAIIKRGFPPREDKLAVINIINSLLVLDVPWTIRDMPYRITIQLIRNILSFRNDRQT
jgi:glycosyltransferase involved in cell wall biosynthesis